MRHSMTGYASGSGALGTQQWTWDLRGVNGKGLDLRVRVPDGIDGLEAGIRAAVTASVARGSLSVSLKLQGAGDEGAAALSEPQLAAVLAAMARIEALAMEQGLSLQPSTSAQIVALRGVMEAGEAAVDTAALCKALLADFAEVLAQFNAMRAQEGAALMEILTGQLDEIARLTAEAAERAEARRDEQAERMRAAMARVTDTAEGVDPQRVAQELALIAVKADVTEEIDRLGAHVAAARTLLAEPGPVGRKLDFLMQEFNREANTLCSKSASVPLTQTGLALKTVIDQMREQVQNLE